jgi:hypothetical protein
MQHRRLGLIVICLALIAFAQPSLAAPRVDPPAGSTVVTITPPYGYWTPPVRVRLSRAENRVVTRLQRLAMTWRLPEDAVPAKLVWHVEPAAQSSPTLALAKRIMSGARKILAWDGVYVVEPVEVVVSRTQGYINSTVSRLGCAADLEATDGVWLMGASVCNGRVIVINLTGYLFLRRAGQVITPALERAPELKLSRTWYLIVARNMRGLAHEWTHSARLAFAITGATRDEPAWFREGLAETISGLASVRATGGHVSYLEYHVMNQRKFSKWTSTCRAPLSRYRATGSAVSGCEYFSGAAATAILLADHGGIARVLKLYRVSAEIKDWPTAFKVTYGMSLEFFEAKADRYIAGIRAVS